MLFCLKIQKELEMWVQLRRFLFLIFFYFCVFRFPVKHVVCVALPAVTWAVSVAVNCLGWVLPTPRLADSASKAFAKGFWNTGKVLSGSWKSADFCSSCALITRDETLSSFGLRSPCAGEAVSGWGEAGCEWCFPGWEQKAVIDRLWRVQLLIMAQRGQQSQGTQDSILCRRTDTPVSMLWIHLEPNF